VRLLNWEYGARLCTEGEVGEVVEIQPMGRGTTQAWGFKWVNGMARLKLTLKGSYGRP
jgi:hypothetical protein